MKKINFIQLIIGAVIAVLTVNSVQANESSFDIGYYSASKHFKDLPYNENDHEFLSLSYNFSGSGHSVGAATFKNSYYKRSILISWGYRWQLSDNLESSLNIGGVTGYDKYFDCKVCPAVEAGIKYTRFKLVQPKLSIFNGAVVFSLSARF